MSQAEAVQRLTDHGPNRLVDARPVRPLKILLQQFKSFIIWILIAAGALSALLGEYLDASAILAIVVLNALIGFYQEYNAEKSVARLKRLTAPTATVRRGGEAGTSPASEIVVGDVLVLQAGDLVAADARLLSSAALSCVEAALTGESKAVAKQPAPFSKPELPLGDRANMVYVGTSVASGTGTAVVVATGMETELGHIAGMIAEAGAEEATPLQRRLDSFGRVLLWGTLGIVALLFVLGLWRGTPLLELVLTAVSLAVAAIPEGLPAVVTVALSIGVMRMARHRTLVRKLAAVETLGSTSVICTDKTGTLTVGEMTAQRIWIDGTRFTVTGQGYTPTGSILHEGHAVTEAQQALLSELAGVLVGGNHARLKQEDGTWTVIGDPTEGALLVAGTKAGADQARLEKDLPRRAAFPFDSERKRSSLVRQDASGGLQLFVNGAPGPLLARCTRYRSLRGIRPLTAGDREKILKETSALAGSALRVLASATRTLEGTLPADPASDTVENDLVFVGLTGMYDPPRPEAKAAMLACQAAGIRIVMITGDHAETARAVAREIGLAAAGDLAVSGVELDRMSDQDLSRKAAKIAVYARVTAAHKLRIVRALRANGEVVAMTGDGINDAPALKGADIGIAMGTSGTEVTKQAADMIITDDNFSTLLVAIEEGRGIYDNIRKTLQFLLSGSAGELLLMTACVIGGLPTPLLPIHLLWINLVTDGLPALCLATDDIDRDVMKRAPRPPSERLTNFAFVRTLVVTGFLTAGVAFAVYVYALQVSSPAVARTAAFTVMVFAELLRAFGARSANKPLWRITPGLSVRLLVVVSVSIGLQFWSQHSAVFGRFLKTSPLSLSQFLLLLLLGALPLVVIEVSKVLRRTDQPHGPRRGETTRATHTKGVAAVPAGVRTSHATDFIASYFAIPRVGRWSLLGVTLLATVSCSTPSSRERLDNLVPVPAQWRQSGALPSSPLSASSVAWWDSFNDPMLTELVNVALTSNRDLHAAFARIEEYQARQRLQRAGLFPSVDGGVSAGQTRTWIRDAASDSTRDVAAASLDASWQIDLFGRQRKLVAAAAAEVFLTFEDHYGMQVSLAAAVAGAYITLRQAEAQLALVELGMKTRQETAQLTLWREQAGTGSALDSRQALTSLELARASLPSLRLTIAQSRTQLTQLCSLTPGSLESRLSRPGAVPVPDGSVVVAIPAEMLRQRPDVRGAELALQAAYARTDATRRLRLPSLALSGSLGVEALQVDRLFNPTTTILNLFAGLSAPLFDAGRIRHSITIQEQLEIQTLDAYAAITLNALGEVEDALASVLHGVDRMSILKRAVAAARETSELATLQFEAGQVDLFIDLDAQRTLLDLEQQQVAAAAGHAQAHVQLYLALGGGWTRLAGDRRSLP